MLPFCELLSSLPVRLVQGTVEGMSRSSLHQTHVRRSRIFAVALTLLLSTAVIGLHMANGTASERPEAAVTDTIPIGRDAKPGATPPRGPVLVAPARAIDGDTLELAGDRVRMFGIDAPERAQDCTTESGARVAAGTRATELLQALAGDAAVTCEVQDTDRYGRKVAVCSSAAGVELNAAMVSEGWAFAYRSFSERYTANELAPAAAGRGVWACRDLMRPWDFRKSSR
jgi:endonuclease YncB( thermonuclease family)